MAPESERIEAFTARMYAMVRKVAVPARSSVVKVVPRSASLNRRPTHDLATAALSWPSRDPLPVIDVAATRDADGGDSAVESMVGESSERSVKAEKSAAGLH